MGYSSCSFLPSFAVLLAIMPSSGASLNIKWLDVFCRQSPPAFLVALWSALDNDGHADADMRQSVVDANFDSSCVEMTCQ
jgi:hypothetical protein